MMITPQEVLKKCKKNIKQEWKLAFFSALIIGLLVHMPVMLSDIPNHDGLSSMHFDQNMITSGRWFLTIACGFSSYYTLPWLIGLLSLLFLACTAAALTELLELRSVPAIVVVSGLLVTFPAAASTFAYVFTMDGYMMALFLAVLSVLLTHKMRLGFLAGGVSLAFSMGIYQAYLSFAVILCIYSVAVVWMEKAGWRKKLSDSMKYLYMGGIGVCLYYIILQVLLRIQGEELSSYQSISGMGGENAAQSGILNLIKEMYQDFAVFTLKGNVFFNNGFSLAALIVLAVLCGVLLVRLILLRKWWKNPGFFVIIGLIIAGLPVAANLILAVSPNVTYHLLMRYQWVLLLILLIAFWEKYSEAAFTVQNQLQSVKCMWFVCGQWLVCAASLVLLFNYAVTDNIGYSNLEKRYEKTYAYCVRLLDRIEQTEGYYQGIPIAIVGVVGDEEFPVTDITLEVTGGMIGVSGDILLYTADNYETFIKNYLGASLNFLDVGTVGDIYYSDEYIAMDSFPGKNSVKLVDGVIYVKTENADRED